MAAFCVSETFNPCVTMRSTVDVQPLRSFLAPSTRDTGWH